MFTKRKSLSYKYDFALEMVDFDNSRIQYLIDRSVIRSNGNFLEIDDKFLQFFEQVLEVNEEINIAYINENSKNIKEKIVENLKKDYVKTKILTQEKFDHQISKWIDDI